MDTHGRSSRAPIDPADYVVGPDTPINEIDLEQEEFILRDGRRLTDELAAELAREARAEIARRNLVPGRKSLTGGGVHSPAIRVRVPEQLKHDIEQRAEAEGVSISVLARRALQQYLAS